MTSSQSIGRCGECGGQLDYPIGFPGLVLCANAASHKDIVLGGHTIQLTAEQRDAVRAMEAESRDKYIRAFNRLEKAVTNHIKDRCIDSDDLAHVHKAVLRDLAEATPKETSK